MRGAGRTVLEAGEAVPGIEEEGVLPDVDPRTSATACKEGTEGSRVGEGDRTGQTGEAGQAELRLCNLVAQSPSHAKGRLQEGGREGTDGAGNGAVGDNLLQALPEPDASH